MGFPDSSDSKESFCNVALQVPLSWGFSGENTGVGCHFLLQGIFPTRGLNARLLYLFHFGKMKKFYRWMALIVARVNHVCQWTVHLTMVKMVKCNLTFILPPFLEHEMFCFVISSQSKCPCIKTSASDMDGPTECHTEWSQFRQRRRNIAWHPSYVESKKKMI